MIIKPFDIHVMHKERFNNSIRGTLKDSAHIEMLGGLFECEPVEDIESGSDIMVDVEFEDIELMDYTEDGGAAGCVSFILYKGNHYQLTVTSDNGDDIYVYTNEVWDDGDIVGIRILPKDIRNIRRI